MEFKDRLKEERIRAGLTQKQLAEMLGVTDRTIQNYEHGRGGAARFSHIKAISEVLHIKAEDLMGEERESRIDTDSEHIAALVKKMTALFSGGDLSDEDKEAAVRAVTEAYWESKQINKKYGRKKNK
jgi:transcriptional regulator with XRE-family HTH domain